MGHSSPGLRVKRLESTLAHHRGLHPAPRDPQGSQSLSSFASSLFPVQSPQCSAQTEKESVLEISSPAGDKSLS